MEVVISMANLGLCVGLPAGLILERCGPRWASLWAMILSILGYFGFYMSMVYPKEFGGPLYWLLNMCALIGGKTINHYLEYS